MSAPIDIGHGVTIAFTGCAEWPERGLAAIERCGLIVEQPNPCELCRLGVSMMLDVPGVRERFPHRNVWTVDSWEPLTLSPSLLFTCCKFHGWIREGKWVPA